MEVFSVSPEAVGNMDISTMLWWHRNLIKRSEQRTREREWAARRR